MIRGIKNKTLIGGAIFWLFLFALSACGGGTDSSSSPQASSSTAVTGKLNSASASQSAGLNMAMRENVAVSDINVVGTDETGSTVVSSTDDVGNFTINLPVGHTYVVSFFSGQTLLGILSFSIDQSGTFDTTAFRLNSGDDSLALGNISCSGGSCTGDVNPLCQLDRDDDGNVDCEDVDDDNDGVKDINEDDSDHDGIEDDLEDDDGEDHQATNDCEVIRVEPFDNEIGVDVDEKIKVRFSNALNTDTVISDNISLSDAGGLVLTTISIENEDDHGEVRLEPTSSLSPLTVYTIQVSTSIQCNNAVSPAANLEVSFTTGLNN